MWHGKQHSMVMERHIMSMEEIQIYTINHDLGFSCRATSQKTQWRKENISHLLLLPQGKETNTRYLHNLEAYSGNITLGFTTATETRNENLIILIHKVQATVILPQCQHCSHRQNMPHTGTKAVTFFPFLMSCTRTHLRMAELGCLASTPTFSSTIPFAWEEPPVGDVL